MDKFLKKFMSLYEKQIVVCSDRKKDKTTGRTMNLGDLIILTEDFKTHKRLRSIGDKSFTQIKECAIETEEYKKIKEIISGIQTEEI